MLRPGWVESYDATSMLRRMDAMAEDAPGMRQAMLRQGGSGPANESVPEEPQGGLDASDVSPASPGPDRVLAGRPVNSLAGHRAKLPRSSLTG